MKVIIKVGLVPEGTRCTKFTKNGIFYTVKRDIKIFTDNPELRQCIEAKNMSFLVSDTGNINLVDNSLEVICFLSMMELHEIFSEEEHD